jgi:hypothetical protein
VNDLKVDRSIVVAAGEGCPGLPSGLALGIQAACPAGQLMALTAAPELQPKDEAMAQQTAGRAKCPLGCKRFLWDAECESCGHPMPWPMPILEASTAGPAKDLQPKEAKEEQPQAGGREKCPLGCKRFMWDAECECCGHPMPWPTVPIVEASTGTAGPTKELKILSWNAGGVCTQE